MDQAALTAYLAAFYDVEGIRTIWKQIGDALMARGQLPIQINQRSRDGGSSAGILVSTPAEATGYMNACQAALRQLGENMPANPGSLGVAADFSYRFVEA